MGRLAFALRMLRSRFGADWKRCPYCHSCLSTLLQRKRLILQARRCVHCGLIFRCPTDDADAACRYYQGAYHTTQRRWLPNAAELSRLGETRFRDTPMDKSPRLPWWERGRTKLKSLDFGCSLGYGIAQLKWAGFDAMGFELARDIAETGAKALGVTIESDFDRLVAEHRGGVGLLYCDHVLEHTQDLRRVLDGFGQLVASGGHLLVFVPNCGGDKARRLGLKWGPFLGESHTIAFTAEWLLTRLPRHGFVVETLGDVPGRIDPLPDGDEMICMARKQ